LGPKGNVEFLVHLKYPSDEGKSIEGLIDAVIVA
jgi:hypothetical protein